MNASEVINQLRETLPTLTGPGAVRLAQALVAFDNRYTPMQHSSLPDGATASDASACHAWLAGQSSDTVIERRYEGGGYRGRTFEIEVRGNTSPMPAEVRSAFSRLSDALITTTPGLTELAHVSVVISLDTDGLRRDTSHTKVVESATEYFPTCTSETVDA